MSREAPGTYVPNVEKVIQSTKRPFHAMCPTSSETSSGHRSKRQESPRMPSIQDTMGGSHVMVSKSHGKCSSRSFKIPRDSFMPWTQDAMSDSHITIQTIKRPPHATDSRYSKTFPYHRSKVSRGSFWIWIQSVSLRHPRQASPQYASGWRKAVEWHDSSVTKEAIHFVQPSSWSHPGLIPVPSGPHPGPILT